VLCVWGVLTTQGTSNSSWGQLTLLKRKKEEVESGKPHNKKDNKTVGWWKKSAKMGCTREIDLLIY